MRRIVAAFLIASLATPMHAASRVPLRAENGIVAVTDGIAAGVGVEILKKGGNAVDAAIATAFAAAVTWPEAGNIGGGGFMLVRMADGRAEAIDYRERAPRAASRDMYLDTNGSPIEDLYTNGHKAVAVPGTVAGLALAHQRHGRLPWRQLVEPAQKLAAEGFVIGEYLAVRSSGEQVVKRLSRFPETRRIFLPNGKPLQRGEILRQPELAATLGRIAKNGPREFYTGETAKLLLDELKSGGGIITDRDLREYQPTIRQPLRGRYKEYEILTMPPPSSGGTALIQMLNMVEKFDVAARGHNSADGIHLLVETMRRAFADRASHLADPDFVAVPTVGLTSKKYAAQIAAGIGDHATPSVRIRAGQPEVYESESTAQISVVDADGNAVSNTYTLESSFGSALTVRGAGFLLNNEMGDFTAAPGKPNSWGLIQSAANAIEPRKRPLSSMTPTIISRDGKLFLVLGSPGGPKIINTVLQVFLNVVEHGMDIQQAVDVPRIHHQWLPDEIYWEARGINEDTRRLLENRGHRFRARAEADNVGDAQVVMIDPTTGIRYGASDPRRGGAPAGY